MSHRFSVRVTLSSFVFAFALAAAARSQSPSSAAVGDSLQQMNVTIDRLHRTLVAVNVEKWKAPGDVRQTMHSDLDSMLRDLNDTLPGLISTAQANPSQVSSAFAVYRNVDALYDVLLRVSETAQLAGASTDASLLEDQRSTLESGRTQLGAALLQSAQAQDSELAQLRNAGTAKPATAPAPSKTVIDDGPATKGKSTAHRTRKPSPASSAPASPAPQ